MKQRFTLYVREHHTGWFTVSVLTLPVYTAYGPHPSALRDEIIDVLEEDLAEGTLILRGEHAFEDLERRTLNLELKAVQNDRLIMVPMRFTLLVRPLDAKTKKKEVRRDLFEVRIPRLGAVFRIQGEDNIVPWAEELVRGSFHLKDVTELLAHQYERSERLETVEITLGAKAKKKARAEGMMARGFEEEEVLPLAEFGTELVREAKKGRVPRASFRDELVSVLEDIVSSRRSPSALLVGPSGVGKTALVLELAHRIATKGVGQRLEDAGIWHIGGLRFTAGARFLGEWQARAERIVGYIQAQRDVLYVGNLLELVSPRGASTGLSVAQFLLPLVQSGELSVVAEATPDALAAAEAIEPAFVRAFQRLPVPSLPVEHTTALLERAATRLARSHDVSWGTGAIGAALDVVARFGDAEALPGSGLDLLEAMVRLAPEKGSVRATMPAAPSGRTELGPSQAIRAFSKISGFPEVLLDGTRRLDVEELRRFFHDRVMGQERAVDLLTNVVLLLKTGLNDPTKPLGSFLFMGPTGVGKTESALTLAEYLFRDRQRLVRFDLSEYGYPGSALRLVDGPGGQGELTRVVRERPFSVLLFDEVEKADPGVFDVLLQVLGEGRLTDGTGRTVRFTHTIVILTSNLGAATKDPVGFSAHESRTAADHRYLEAAGRFFRPELLNRLDHVVPFGPLSEGTIRSIASRLLEGAFEREGLKRRGITVAFGPELLDLVVRRGYDPKYGARPMKRALEALVTVPLSKRLMTWPEATGGTIALEVVGDEVRLS